MYIADTENNRIRKVTVSTGIITTVAGTGGHGFSGDHGPATSATFKYPTGIVIDSAGNVFIADYDNNRVRKVTVSTGIITTIVGCSTSGGYSGDNSDATAARLDRPYYLALDAAENIYISDSGNDRIRKVMVATTSPSSTPTVRPTGPSMSPTTVKPSSSFPSVSPSAVFIISTIAGIGYYDGDGGAATSAIINYPAGVAVDASGGPYVYSLLYILSNHCFF